MYTIRRLTAEELPASAESLSGLLMDAVDGGSSLGFLASLDLPAATAWWQALAPEVAAGRLALWVALDADGRVAGTVRLRPADPANGRHRAEIAKLTVHRADRGRRLATHLLAAAELHAPALGISLLVLDTRTDSPAERLYEAAGWPGPAASRTTPPTRPGPCTRRRCSSSGSGCSGGPSPAPCPTARPQ